MTLAERLQALLATLPQNGAVTFTRADLAELLETEEQPQRAAGAVAVDLTVPEVAALFGRTASCVRNWIAEQRFPGAYRMHGREWRVPRADVAALQRAEAERFREQPQRSNSARKAPDTSAWREHLRPAG